MTKSAPVTTSHTFKLHYNRMNNSINAVGREDELSLPLAVAYCLAFISSRCEQVSEAAVLCNSDTLDSFEHFHRPKEINKEKVNKRKENKYRKTINKYV